MHTTADITATITTMISAAALLITITSGSRACAPLAVTTPVLLRLVLHY